MMHKKRTLILAPALLAIALLSSGCASTFGESNRQVDINNNKSLSGFLKNELDRSPGNIEARYQLALSYIRAGNFDTAIELLEQVVSIDPSYDHALINLAKVHLEQSRNLLSYHQKLTGHSQTAEARLLLSRVNALR